MTPDGPRVAVVGRQNVGKSTLVNRLLGRRAAIAHEAPGVTRDRVEVDVTWRGRPFTLIDTGGFARGGRGIDALVTDQADRAARAADVVLLVVDAQAGVREDDAAIARRLRRSTGPVLLVANKVDSDRDEADAAAFYALGLGEPIGVSALHGRGSGDLLDRIALLLPPEGSREQVEGEPRFAIVGRSNVGKSSLFNRLVGEERSVVYEEAGTTRDAVDAVVRWPQGSVRFVDTAGFRRSAKRQGIDYYSFLRAVGAIERSHVVMLVLDAADGFTTEDRKLAARVLELGRALVIVANKWDLVEDKDRTFKELGEAVAAFGGAQAVRTSALRGTGVHRLRPILLDVHERWSRRVATAPVNDVLQAAQLDRPAPRDVGRFRYATQVAAGPPSFVVFGSKPPGPAYRRFLEGRLRRAFGFQGVPIRLSFRARGPRGASRRS